MSRGQLSWGSIILGGNCSSAIIWGQFSKVGILQGAFVREVIVREAIVQGAFIVGGNCPGEIIWRQFSLVGILRGGEGAGEGELSGR